MSSINELGRRAIESIYALWEVESDRAILTKDGFDWWPGHFRQSLRCSEEMEIEGVRGCRVTASTDVLRGTVNWNPLQNAIVNAFARITPSYSLRSIPEEFSTRYQLDLDERTMSFVSAAFIHDENAAWFPKFFGAMVLMQPIDAQIQGDYLQTQLSGELCASSPRSDGTLLDFDGMLEIVAQIYAPEGKSASRWSDCTEFDEVAENYGKSDQCFGFGDCNGLTLETPFGNDSALIRLHSDQTHPRLGNGLLATLQCCSPIAAQQRLPAAAATTA